MLSKSFNHNSGMTLLEAIVTLAVFGVVAIALASTNGFLSNVTSKLHNDFDLMEIKQELKSFVDCKHSIDQAKLRGAGHEIKLFKKDGTELYQTESQPGNFADALLAGNRWYLRAVYTGTSIAVRAAKRSGNTFALNTLDKSELNFNHPKNVLFSEDFGVARLCEDAQQPHTFEISRLTTKSKDLFPIMGWPPNANHGDRFWRNNMKYTSGCHKYCNLNSFTTGIVGDISDNDEIWVDGKFVETKPRLPGEALTVCICFN